MSIVSLFKSGFFSDVFTLRIPLLTIGALIVLIGCGYIQWRLNTSPKRQPGKISQYYLAIVLIALIVIIDFVELFVKGQTELLNGVVRNAFGLTVCGIIGMAVSAGIWYLKIKKGKEQGK